MQHQFIPSAKITRPRLPEHVLIRRNLSVVQSRVTFVCAPAGYGKSTFALQLALPLGERIAWMGLDEFDNAIEPFFTLLLRSLAHVDRSFESVDSDMQQAHFVISLVKALEGVAPLVLVIDDYQFINNTEVHKELKRLILLLPEHIKFVIVSRTLPPLDTSAMVVKKNAVIYTQADLELSCDDTKHFLNTDDNSVALRVNNISGGWIAAVKLLSSTALSLQDISVEPDQQSGLFDYLGTEVFSTLPANVQKFLLQTAVLRNFDRDVAEHLIGADSNYCLDYLIKNQLFIIADTSTQQGFRYHHLFSTFLVNQLRKSQPNLERKINLQLADYYTEKQRLRDACYHVTQSKDFDAQLEFLQLFGPTIRNIGRYHLAPLLDALAARSVANEPWLILSQAWLALDDQQIGVARDIADRLNSEDLDDLFVSMCFHELLAQINEIEEQMASAKYHAEKALSLIDGSNSPEKIDSETCLMILASALLHEGNIEASLSYYKKAYALQLAKKRYGNSFWTSNQIAAIYALRGDVALSKNLFVSAISNAKAKNIKYDKNLIFLHASLARTLISEGKFSDAEAICNAGLDVAQKISDYWTLHIYDVFIHLYFVTRNLTAIENLLPKIEAHLSLDVHRVNRLFIDDILVQYWIFTKQKEKLANWVSGNPAPSASLNWSDHMYVRTYYSAHAALNRASDDANKLLLHSQSATDQSLHLCAVRSEICALNIKTRSNKLTHDEVQRCLAKTAQHNLVGDYVGYGFFLQPMLTDICSSKKTDPNIRQHASNILNVFSSLQIENTTTDRIMLTRRERQLIALLKEDLPRKVMAQKLNLSIDTVKSHLQSLYRKLDVTNKRDAVKKFTE